MSEFLELLKKLGPWIVQGINAITAILLYRAGFKKGTDEIEKESWKEAFKQRSEVDLARKKTVGKHDRIRAKLPNSWLHKDSGEKK